MMLDNATAFRGYLPASAITLLMAVRGTTRLTA